MAALLLAGPLAGEAAAQRDIGVAAVAVNRVAGSLGGQSRVLGVGDQVFQNERIETARDARAQLLFIDETTLTVGPGSMVVLDTFVFDPERSAHKVVIDATQGLFRFVSGQRRKDTFEIRTPVATIAVRGTILDMLIDADGRTSVMVVEGAADLTALGSGLVERLDRAGLASTVTREVAIPTPAAPPSAQLRQRLSGISPTEGDLLAAATLGFTDVTDLPSGLIIDSTLPAEVVRDRLGLSSGGGGSAPGRPGNGILVPPRLPGTPIPSIPGPAVSVTNPGPIRPIR